jgi:succinate dehydrogenase flavin-adding protein (antitoxin of CptAB toxin-antitoxin module)
MLELDLVLSAFLNEHLNALEPQQLDAFKLLLERPDPELLNLVMGHEAPVGRHASEVVALLRNVMVHDTTVAMTLTPGPSRGGRREICGADS